MATVKSFNADVSSVSPSSERKATKHSDEGLTLETSALKLFTVVNLHYQLSWWNQIILINFLGSFSILFQFLFLLYVNFWFSVPDKNMFHCKWYRQFLSAYDTKQLVYRFLPLWLKYVDNTNMFLQLGRHETQFRIVKLSPPTVLTPFEKHVWIFRSLKVHDL